MYIMKILGAATILGGIAIPYGRFRTLKEWAYAGFTFNMIGAIASHVFAHQGLRQYGLKLGLLCPILASYWLWKNDDGLSLLRNRRNVPMGQSAGEWRP